jgi:hypothetical protein
MTDHWSSLQQMNSLRNPFKDIEQYLLPIYIAIVSWIAHFILHWTCNASVCISTKQMLYNVYMYIIVVGLVVFSKQIWYIVNHLGMVGKMMNNTATAMKAKAD